MIGDVLYYFTRGFSSGITLLRTVVRGLLPNLYVINETKSSSRTPLIYDGDFPNINPQSYGEYLNLLGDMFGLSRNLNEEDKEFRRRILFSIGQSATISGISSSMSRLLSTYGIAADIEIRENFTNAFDGTSSTFDVPMRDVGGTLLYGLSVVITPKSYDASAPVLDENGDILYRKVDIFNFDSSKMEENIYPLGVEWRRVKNLYFDRLLESFRAESFRSLVDDISAAGIRVDRVIIREPGAGGSKGEVYYGN
jgi:hypothetical protein